jgi:hypothetical protein
MGVSDVEVMSMLVGCKPCVVPWWWLHVGCASGMRTVGHSITAVGFCAVWAVSGNSATLHAHLAAVLFTHGIPGVAAAG